MTDRWIYVRIYRISKADEEEEKILFTRQRVIMRVSSNFSDRQGQKHIRYRIDSVSVCFSIYLVQKWNIDSISDTESFAIDIDCTVPQTPARLRMYMT